ncbi:ran-binding protein 1 homolog b-like [Typha angustifolia]|uniref:ran-binding protein 1 homolog b-like n=1 Tax=Typha angustifolia TaxID=59011 RepID=UPI003C30A708
MASTEPKHREDEEETSGVAAGDEEDTGAQIAPIIKLEEVAVTTGEEDEDVLLDLKAKLYRHDKEGNQWKERGTGNVKLLKHKVTGKVRLVMRQAKTLKICANHLVVTMTKLQEHVGNDKSCVWYASDFSDGELKEEMFAIRFVSVENRKKFMEMVQEISESLGKNEEKESKEAASTAGLMEKLSVSESKKEENTATDVPAATGEKEVRKETQTKSEESSSAA